MHGDYFMSIKGENGDTCLSLYSDMNTHPPCLKFNSSRPRRLKVVLANAVACGFLKTAGFFPTQSGGKTIQMSFNVHLTITHFHC